MSNTLDKLYSFLRTSKRANPFSDNFSLQDIELVINKQSKDELLAIDFIDVCNNFYSEIRDKVFEIYSILNYENEEIIEYLYKNANKYYINFILQSGNQINESSMLKADELSFLKFKAGDKEVNIELASELGGDILSELIEFHNQWLTCKARPQFDQSKKEINKDELFYTLWILGNTHVNLKLSGYNTFLYKNGEIHLLDENTIKIKSTIKSVELIMSANSSRTNSNTHEVFSYIYNRYKRNITNTSPNSIIVENGFIKPTTSNINPVARAMAHANIFVFYPHLLSLKLNTLGGLTILDLSDLLSAVTSIINKLYSAALEEPQYNNEDLAAFKIRKNELINSLHKSSGISKVKVRRFVESLINYDSSPFLWNQPFMEIDGSILFSTSVSIAPNHSLYYDRWLKNDGYTEDKLNKLFRIHIKSRLKELKLPYFFKILNDQKEATKNSIYNDSIIIQTQNKTILLVPLTFNFPIEAPDVYRALSQIGQASIKANQKREELKKLLGLEEQPIAIIITNHNHFSGLNINNVSVSDFTLFSNYVKTGHYATSSTTISDGFQINSIRNDSAPYYKDEDEFNNNLEYFFQKPIPVHNLVENLRFEEISILPTSFNYQIKIDSITRISNKEILDQEVLSIDNLLSYQYYNEPNEEELFSINRGISFSLHEVFSQIAYALYQDYDARGSLFQSFAKTKKYGLAHLSVYLLESFNKLNGKAIENKHLFNKIEYEIGSIDRILKKILSNKKATRLLDFIIPDGIISFQEEQYLISFSLDLFSTVTQKIYSDEDIEDFLFWLMVLQSLTKKHSAYNEFYIICANIIEAFNFNHKYQSARDLSEEILQIAIRDGKNSYGWNILFRCYTTQRNTFDAALYGSIYITSLLHLPEIPYELAFEVMYNGIKYFRNIGDVSSAKFLYQNAINYNLSEYENQKISLSYFNTVMASSSFNHDLLKESLEYFHEHLPKIIEFGNQGVIPWLAYMYNLKNVQMLSGITLQFDLLKAIENLEQSVDAVSLSAIQDKLATNEERVKDFYISSILSIYETRSSQDFIYEIHNLSVIANKLLARSIETNDYDGLLLAGLVINDQSFVYKSVSIEPNTLAPVTKPKDEAFEYNLKNYKNYILKNFIFRNSQCIVWLFNLHDKVYTLTIDTEAQLKLSYYPEWKLDKMQGWLSTLSSFYFDSKRNKFSNPNKESLYDFSTQETDYTNLKHELLFSSIEIPKNCSEVLFYSTLDLSNFPHNLIEVTGDFIARQMPVTNIYSIERLISRGIQLHLPKAYTISAWIPIDDQEPIISWGFKILNPLLLEVGAEIYTNTYPHKKISTDVNVFLAHGVLDNNGFKAVYTNHNEKIAITIPSNVFGTGKIGILFICNSGSSTEDFTSHSIISFAGELLKDKYEAVIAPFWSFDVTMSKIWLKEFLSNFNEGFSVSEAVWLANRRLSEYDEDSSSMYFAPAGQLAMHLYGNPNISISG